MESLQECTLFYMSLMYFFAVESALELSKRFNKELLSGLRAEEGTFHALLVITTCKKKICKFKINLITKQMRYTYFEIQKSQHTS